MLTGQRWRALILSVSLSVVAYLGFSLWGGWREVVAAVRHVGWYGAGAMLALSCLNYWLRFERWQLYLRCLGHRLPWFRSLGIYIAGFGLTTTPGKAGEAVRSVFLKPLGVSYQQSVAAFLSERLSDLLAVVLLACLGLVLFPAAWPLVVAGITGVAVLLAVLCHPAWLARWDVRLIAAKSRGGKLAHRLVQLLLEARQLHTPGVVAIATLLSVVAWGAEACAFSFMLHLLGQDLTLNFAVFTYAFSMLAGALSFMPGGLGGAEAAMVTLLQWAGTPHGYAVAGTVLIRLTTLWFAVGLGLAALLFQLRTISEQSGIPTTEPLPP